MANNHNWKRDALRQLPPECVCCGLTNRSLLTVDHVIPRAEGGSDSIDNMRVVCWSCHREITAEYRKMRLTEVDKDGVLGKVNTWKRPRTKRHNASKAKYANRASGW